MTLFKENYKTNEQCSLQESVHQQPCQNNELVHYSYEFELEQSNDKEKVV